MIETVHHQAGAQIPQLGRRLAAGLSFTVHEDSVLRPAASAHVSQQREHHRGQNALFDVYQNDYRGCDGGDCELDRSMAARTTEAGGLRGHDGGKKVSGRKRQILVDTEGNLLKARVHQADIHDRRGAELLLSRTAAEWPQATVPAYHTCLGRHGLPGAESLVG